jgi:hypothetical protein
MTLNVHFIVYILDTLNLTGNYETSLSPTGHTSATCYQTLQSKYVLSISLFQALIARKIKRYARVDITYQSQEDFRVCTDILRCEERFYNRQRYDGVLLRTMEFRFGRLEGAFRCFLPGGIVHDVLLVRKFREISWRPPSSWDGCRVVTEDDDGFMFITRSFLIRGVLLVDTDLRTLPGERFFVDDMIDNDMFLRMGN